MRLTYQLNQERLVNQVTILDSIWGNDSHNGSRIQFDDEGYLFLSMGDAYNAIHSQYIDNRNGKILRMTPSGGIPSDNPFPGHYTWSYGHRNPQGLCFGRNGILYSSEHGSQTDDEVNIVERARNYGWPLVEGFCDTPSEQGACDSLDVREPIIAYTPTDAPCGMDYFDHPSIPEWRHSLILGFLKERKIEVLPLSDDGMSLRDGQHWGFLDEHIGRIRDVLVSPTGRLFVCTSNRETKAGVRPIPGENHDKIIELVNVNYDYPEYEKELVVGDAELFPNPASDNVFISLQTAQTELVYEITDMQGKIIASGEETTPFEGLWQIILPEVRAGLYVLNYSVPGQDVRSERLMIIAE